MGFFFMPNKLFHFIYILFTPPPQEAPPSPVVGISASDVTYNSLLVAWTANSAAKSYIVLAKSGATVLRFPVASGETSTTISGLKPLTHYLISVTLVSTSDFIVPAASDVEITTLAKPLAKPSPAYISKIGTNAVTVEFPVPSGADIQANISSGSTGSVVLSIEDNIEEVASLTANTEYSITFK